MAQQSLGVGAASVPNKNIDGQSTSGTGNFRQTVTIGDPSTDANVAAVTANGVAVDIKGVGGAAVDNIPANYINGTTAAITDTSSTQVIASAGGSLRNYISSILVTNSHATVGTFVKILDGITIIYEGYAAPAGGGFAAALPTPLRGSAATAINAQCVTSGANVIVSCAGYKGS